MRSPPAPSLREFSGALYGHLLGHLSTETFSLALSLSFLTMAVIGGLHSRAGAFLGGAYLALAPELLRELKDAQMVIYGITLILCMQFLPGGLISIVRADRARGAADLRWRCLRSTTFRSRSRVCARSLMFPSPLLRGEIVGLIGPNGAGKSTLLNCICRLYRPDAGRIRFDGIDLAGRRIHQVASMGVRRTFQNLELFRAASVRENIVLGLAYRYKSSLWSEFLDTPSCGRNAGWRWTRRRRSLKNAP